jgi:hypothetical protein
VQEVVATSVEQLAAITKLVHDRWFELSKVDFDVDRRWLTVPFVTTGLHGRSVQRHGLLWREVVPLLRAALTIKHVHRFQFVDEIGIDRYEFNEITFFESTYEVVITSGFPIEIRATVGALEVSVVVSDDVVDHETHTSSFRVVVHKLGLPRASDSDGIGCTG